MLPSGYKSWRWKISIRAKGEAASLRPYPSISLNEAREIRNDAARVLRKGEDPAISKRQRAAEQAVAAGSTFEAVALELHGEPDDDLVEAPRGSCAEQLQERHLSEDRQASGRVDHDAVGAGGAAADRGARRGLNRAPDASADLRGVRARSAPVRLAERHEFEGLDGPEPIWRIPAAKMTLGIERKRVTRRQALAWRGA
ncbi:Arm DNA-binding domain-containing protein [Sphingomonas sp. LR60]|uniref:Arm DNA-binding domain-containing protein n=1 Tax=Sphingomonas sp. LR60 TaxID=3050233 RepID=UPI002FDF3248